MKYDYTIDQSLCICCATCLVGCNFGAVLVSPLGKFSIDAEKCRSCGVCFRDCPKDAVIRSEKEEENK